MLRSLLRIGILTSLLCSVASLIIYLDTARILDHTPRSFHNSGTHFLHLTSTYFYLGASYLSVFNLFLVILLLKGKKLWISFSYVLIYIITELLYCYPGDWIYEVFSPFYNLIYGESIYYYIVDSIYIITGISLLLNFKEKLIMILGFSILAFGIFDFLGDLLIISYSYSLFFSILIQLILLLLFYVEQGKPDMVDAEIVDAK